MMSGHLGPMVQRERMRQDPGSDDLCGDLKLGIAKLVVLLPDAEHHRVPAKGWEIANDLGAGESPDSRARWKVIADEEHAARSRNRGGVCP